MTSNEVVQRTPEWYAARKARVTASIAGAVLGCDPNMTRDDAMRMLCREWHGLPSEFEGNVATEHGRYHEKGIHQDYEMETGEKIEPASFVPYEDWSGASPDGWINKRTALVEIKAPYGLRKALAPVPFKSIKQLPHYFAQVQLQLFVCNVKFCHFYQWAPKGTQLEIVKRDDKYIKHTLLPALRDFYAAYLTQRDMPIEELRVTLDGTAERQLVAEWSDNKKKIAELEARQKELVEKFADMSKQRNAVICGYKLTKVEKVGNIAYAKVVKEKLPKLNLEPYRGKSSSYWKFTAPGEKDGET